MSKYPELLAPALVGALGLVGAACMATALAASEPSVGTGDSARSAEGGFGLGREALPEEISAWDIDVRPDGQGLPEGSGDVLTGEDVYLEKCASCHGDFAEGLGRWPKLAGGEGTLTDQRPVKTIGSYWPFLSTVYDYVNRAMPFGYAQSLTADEVYAITAYLLYSNYIVEDDFVLTRDTFADVEMPNHGNFFMDDRAEVEIPALTGDVCMSDCKDNVEITARAAILDVTPEDTEAREAREAEAAAAQGGGGDTEMASVDTDAASGGGAHGDLDPDLVAAGEEAFRQCRACHEVGTDAKNRVGPVLNDIVGAEIASVDGFNYSSAFEEAAAEGLTWTEEELARFLADPRDYLQGTKMAFAGVENAEDVEALIAYLKSAGE